MSGMIKVVLNTVRSGLRIAVMNKLQQSFFQVFIQIVLTRIGANRISGMPFDLYTAPGSDNQGYYG